MEVIVGPTFSIDVSAPAAYVRDRNGASAQDKASAASASPCLFSKDDEGGVPAGRPSKGIRSVSRLGLSDKTAEYSSDSSSSIGAPGDSEDEDESGEDVAVSSKDYRVCGFGSLSSLEDSLPIKRGLSNHYKGKSKSFGNLSEVSAVKDVEKTENPLNKRRRLLISNKWSRRSSFYSWQNPKSMPLLPVDEGDDDGDKDEQEAFNDDPKSSRSSSSDDEDKDKPKLRQRKLFKSGFKSQSCFSLADLQKEHH